MKRFGFLRTFNQLITKRDAYHLETRVIKPSNPPQKKIHCIYLRQSTKMVLLTTCTRHNPVQQIVQLIMTKKRVQLWDISGPHIKVWSHYLLKQKIATIFLTAHNIELLRNQSQKQFPNAWNVIRTIWDNIKELDVEFQLGGDGNDSHVHGFQLGLVFLELIGNRSDWSNVNRITF